MHPTNGRITQEYGTYPQASGEPWGHTGRDYAGNIGDEVRAIADGEIIFADWSQNMSHAMADKYMFVRGSGNGGIMVLIQHGGWVSVYAHLDATPLNPGNKVRRGQRVGSLGTTGRSTGAHLHFEVLTTPCPNTAMFGRYAPGNQIAHEDKLATPKPVAVKPAPPKAPATRTITADVAAVLTAPNSRAPLSKAYANGLKRGAVIGVLGYVAGEDITGRGDNAWFKTVSGYYVWANAAGNSLAGLKQLA